MSALKRVLCGYALLLFSMAAVAQTYGLPETVYLPMGKTPVVRVASVASILRHYTAADLEMKPGDLIFAIDGIAVESAEKFTELFEKKTADASVQLDFLRGGVVCQSIGPMFRFTRGVFKSDKPKWGGALETTTADFSKALLEKPVTRRIMALDLSYVKDHSAAANAGMQKHDLLVSVNDKSIGRAERSDIIVPLFREGTPLHFVYLRDGKTLEGTAPLTVVKTGFAKILSFGFSGESKMVEIESKDPPQEIPKDVVVEKPA